MTRPAGAVDVNFPRLRQELDWWLADQVGLGEARDAALERAAMNGHTTARTLRRLLAGDDVSAGLAERILDAIEYRDGVRRCRDSGRLLPFVIRSRYVVDGRARQPGELGRIKRVDFANAKLTERQLRALHRLHIEAGLSLRELCRLGWREWGYANEHAALNSVSERLRSIGLQPRSRSEATALANQQRPGVEKPAHVTRSEWRRRKRAERRAVDPAYRAAELERIAGLRDRERRPGRLTPTTS